MIKRNINDFVAQSLVVTSLIFVLTACGGGGGGGGGGTSATPLPTAAVTITNTNAPQVAGAGFDTGKNGQDLPIVTGVQTSVPAVASHPPLTNIQMLAKIAQKSGQSINSPANPQVVTGAVVTQYCLVSGNYTVSSSDPTSGSASFNNCSDVAGETINGTLSLSGMSVSADGNTVSFNAIFSLSVATTSPANTMTVTGDMAGSISLNSFAMSISGSNLTMRNSTASFGDFALLNYTVTIDGITGYATVMTYTYSSTAIGGIAVFNMTSQFTYTNPPHIFPNSGAATIAGANSTILKVTVQGDETAPVGSQVMLELSTDGGANYGVATYKTWAEISNYL